MASTRTYGHIFNRCVDLPDPMQTYLDGVLVAEKVDDLERVRNNANGQELLAVVAALHHKAIGDIGVQTCSFAAFVCCTHLSTRRSTIGICAFLNCFFA